MARRIHIGLFTVIMVAATAFPAGAQLLPQVTPKPATPPATKPAQIVVETSPNAEVYLDDQYTGRANPEGRLAIGNPKPGEHNLRVSLAGKRDFQQKITVVAGKEVKIVATLADLPGSILVRTTPGAEVSVDNSSRGVADASGQLAVSDVAAGAHALRIAAPGKKDFSQTLNVSSGQETRFEAALLDLGPPTSGEVRENPRDGLKYVWIPPGTFLMGCSAGDDECLDHERPSHQVTISKGFWIGQTEATVGAYKRFAAATGRQMPPAPRGSNGWANDDMPIVNVTWNDARDFCAWAGGRLATEAEWEYAARGGSTAARYGPIDEVAWYDKNSGGQTAAVAQKGANGFGLFDTLGNAYEWVNDWYDEHYYSSSPGTDPRGPASGQYRVLRGGSSHCDPINVRVSNRYGVNPAYRYADDGFRCGGEVLAP
jgi:formylglycine-generating enzyme required for sulfatase activity/biopolymer transport protein ExbD